MTLVFPSPAALIALLPAVASYREGTAQQLGQSIMLSEIHPCLCAEQDIRGNHETANRKTDKTALWVSLNPFANMSCVITAILSTYWGSFWPYLAVMSWMFIKIVFKQPTQALLLMPIFHTAQWLRSVARHQLTHANAMPRSRAPAVQL